jgi:hypothetical protein
MCISRSESGCLRFGRGGIYDTLVYSIGLQMVYAKVSRHNCDDSETIFEDQCPTLAIHPRLDWHEPETYSAANNFTVKNGTHRSV